MVATTWIGVIAAPAATVAKVGLEITGTVLGLMVVVSVKGAPVPAALVAVSVVVKTPLVVGVPVIWPLVVFRPRPAGKLLPPASAYESTGALLATIW